MKVRIYDDDITVYILRDDDVLFACDVEVSDLFYIRYQEVMKAFTDLQDELEAMYQVSK